MLTLIENRLVKKNVIDLSIPQNVADLAASYQYCAFSHILHRVKSAIHLHPPTTLVYTSLPSFFLTISNLLMGG